MGRAKIAVYLQPRPEQGSIVAHARLRPSLACDPLIELVIAPVGLHAPIGPARDEETPAAANVVRPAVRVLAEPRFDHLDDARVERTAPRRPPQRDRLVRDAVEPD